MGTSKGSSGRTSWGREINHSHSLRSLLEVGLPLPRSGPDELPIQSPAIEPSHRVFPLGFLTFAFRLPISTAALGKAMDRPRTVASGSD